MDRDVQVKLAVYRHFAETGQRPSPAEVADRAGVAVADVQGAYLRLRAQRVLLLEPERRVRHNMRAAAREWRVWALYAIPVTVYLGVYVTRPYLEHWHFAPLGQVWDYLRIAWLDGFAPALFGIRVTPSSGPLVHTWAVVACQVALLAIVATSVILRRSAWRAWLFLAIAFLINALIVVPRISRVLSRGCSTPRYRRGSTRRHRRCPTRSPRPGSVSSLRAPGSRRRPRHRRWRRSSARSRRCRRGCARSRTSRPSLRACRSSGRAASRRW